MKAIFYFIFFPPSYPNFQIHIPVNLKIKKLWPKQLIKNKRPSEFYFFLKFHYILFQRDVRETCEHIGVFLKELLQGSFSQDKAVM